MSSQFSVSIPESHWKRITDEHKDGRLVWIRGEVGNVDLARWDHGEWNCELGSVDDPTDVAHVSIDVGIDTTKRLLAALTEIRDSRFCSYENSGSGQYGIGVADGHRFCSEVARKAIDPTSKPRQ